MRRSHVGKGLAILGAAVGVALVVAVVLWPRPRAATVLSAKAEVSDATLELGVPVSALVAAAQRADDSSVREALARDLRSRPGQAATDAIVALLGDDAPEVRLAAAESLEARADRHSLIPIAARVEDEEDLDVEGALRRALGKMTAER